MSFSLVKTHKRTLLLAPILTLPLLAFIFTAHARTSVAFNSPPVAGADDYRLHGRTEVAAPGFLGNDADPEGDPLHITDPPGCKVTSSFGQFCIHTARDGGFTYIPPQGFAGADASFYTVCDNKNACVTATITFNVGNSPPSAADDLYSVRVGSFIELPAPGFLGNDTDPEGDPFSAVGEHPVGQCGPLNRGWFCRGSDGNFRYTPSFDHPGTDAYVYRACDNLGACSTATITFDIYVEAPTPTPTPVPTPEPTPEPTPAPDPCSGAAFASASATASVFSPCPPPPPPPTPTPTPEPLIFIPGIGGSRLISVNADGESTVWPALNPIPVGNTLTLDPNKPQRNIYASDALREIVVRNPFTDKIIQVDFYKPLLQRLADSGYREYEVGRDPIRRTTAGCDLSQKGNNPTLFVFAYDWRKSNEQNAALLKDYVGCVRRFYPDRKLNILAHSMGGLLARRYILDNPGTHNVNKAISIGSPWLGAPKAIHVLETGEFFGKFLSVQIKELVEFFPGMHQLLPSRSYFALGGRPFGEGSGEAHWDVNQDGKMNTEYTFNQLEGLLDGKQFVRSKPAQTSSAFHDIAGQDDWRNDHNGVQYYHFFGIQRRPRTIGKVIAVRKKETDGQGQITYQDAYITELEKGDGTVPQLSAERKALRQNLNARMAVMRAFVPEPEPPGSAFPTESDSVVEHLALTRNPRVLDAILQSLKPKPPQAARRSPKVRPRTQKVSFTWRQEGSDAEDEPTQTELGENFDLQIYGLNVESLLVTDAFGKDTSIIEGTPFRNELAEVDIFAAGERSVQLLLPVEMPTDQFYKVTFRTINEPSGIEIQRNKGSSSTATQVIRYRDLNLPAGTALLLKFTPRGVEDLRYDGDGDGTFESTITPTASAVGAAARDTAAPVVTFSEKVQGTKRSISITAEDNETGVMIVRYSLDGRKFQSYTAPFELDACQTRTVYAFADDKVANRSETFEHHVPNLPPDVSQARPGVATLWPANHRMADVSIEGVTDPDCDPVTITITRIVQDEPVDGAGDGNTCPDAQGVGASAAQLRAERSGSGNGRVYTIYFTATDKQGNSSKGRVKVGVPKSSNSAAVDDGTEFDSTACPQ